MKPEEAKKLLPIIRQIIEKLEEMEHILKVIVAIEEGTGKEGQEEEPSFIAEIH